MRCKWMLVLCLAVVGTLSSSGGATGQVPAGDSVIGEAGWYPENGRIDARSGPNGENPTGWVSYDRLFSGRVTCLEVTGTTAVIGFTGEIYYSPLGTILEQNGIVRVVDNGQWFDYFEASIDAAYPETPPRPVIPAPTDCSSYPGPFPSNPSYPSYAGGPPQALVPGGLVVTDAPVPAPPPPGPPKYSVERETDLQWVLSRGITLELTCESACRLRARLYLGAKQARKLKLTTGRKPVPVGKANGRLTKAGDLSAIVTFNPRTRKRLKHARALKLVLKTTLTAAGYTRTRTHPLSLKAKRD